MSDGTTSYWWCLTHSTVEPDEGCASDNRLGPYPSAAEAERAVQNVRDRTAAQDARDRAEDDW